METSTSANEEIATPVVENVPTVPTDETLHIHSAPHNDKLSEGSSMPPGESSVSEPLMEHSSSGKANSSSDPVSMDQPAVDCKPKRTSSGPERKHTLGEDPAAMTIEFLRARLLSERAISKSAKQQTEQLAKKVIELERILQAEMERRTLSQIAAEQALTKLQNAGVHLDSKQLDIFVREFDSRKKLPNYQDKENTARRSQSESLTNSILKSQRVHNMRGSEELNNHYNDSNLTKPDQIPMKPQLDSTNHELEGDENGGRDNPDRLSENEGVDLQALSPASDTLRPVPVRGVGRSCRTFKKRHTRKNSSSSSESGWTDLGQSDTADFDCEKEQYPSEKDNFRSSANQVHRQAFDALEVQSDDTSSTELLAEQNVKAYSGQNSKESEAAEEVKKLLEHRAEFIALNQSQENAQMLWEQQHSSQSTSEQTADLQSDLPVDNLETPSHKLDTKSKSMLQDQEEKSEPGCNTLQLQEQELKNQNVFHASTLITPNADDSGSSISEKERQSFERMTDEPLRGGKSIKELQFVEEDKTHILTEQLELNVSEIGKATHTLAHKEEPSVHLFHIKKKTLAGNSTGENSWAGVPLKADLQRQALNSRDVLDSFQNSNTSHDSRNSEVPQRFEGYLEENEKHSWKPSSSDNFYKDVLSRGQGHKHAAGTNRERPERTSLHQDQLYPQRPRLSDPLFPVNSFRLLYEASLKRQQESDNHMHRKEFSAAPYSVHMSKQHSLESYLPSRRESQMHFTDERAHKVLMALRLAKEQIRESIDQRQLLTEYANARSEDFQIAVGAGDYSYSDYRNPSLGYPVMRQNEELQQRGLLKDFRRSSLYSSDNGQQNYVPSFNPAFISDFKHYPSITGTDLMPRHVPLSHEPVSSYVDKLNVGKGIEFFFRK